MMGKFQVSLQRNTKIADPLKIPQGSALSGLRAIV